MKMKCLWCIVLLTEFLVKLSILYPAAKQQEKRMPFTPYPLFTDRLSVLSASGITSRFLLSSLSTDVSS